ncbi:MarP family serine protease [Microbacterium sp. C7(2022)]|uniref:MarP family serine protease n=1 Tax=Microbacterium sp. C7(2022) TaxID=2992759 RepID=UPI00237A8094|nr:MarP family serine protease [Microbacterium sp. C7(2022)]MDE0545737.1 MarP family serine protease [Microbacterium sp. C7(2022)]
MLVVDIVLIVILVIALAAGASRGFTGSIGVFAGIAAGAAAAYWLVPLLNDWWPWPQWRLLASVAAAIGLILVGSSLGAAAGAAVRRGVDRTPLRGFDRLLGALTGVAVSALVISLTATGLIAAGVPIVSSALSSSQVVRTIDSLTPDPVDRALAEVRAIVIDEGLPQLGELLEVTPTQTMPPVDLEDPALAQAAASVARVSGTAFACGRSSTGSGFVIADDRIVTNAHVVAGVDQPLVELPGRAAQEGRIVYFDPVDDLAVIAVDDLDARVLPLSRTLDAGAAGVVQGYPLGGPFTMVGASVLSVGSAPVPDIYAESSASREIYALEATVRPGNSGGPLLTGEGAVAGVVFARAEADENLGYAMTIAELLPVVAQAESLERAVSSGSCVTA